MLLILVFMFVIVILILSLSRLNVIFSLLIATVVGGITAGLGLEETITILVGGLGGQGETALSYILLGILAVMIARSGITGFLIRLALPLMQGRQGIVLFTLFGIGCLSKNVVPIHIAFIPILIPLLLTFFNWMNVDSSG